MLRSPDEVKAGETVFLYPQTKQASANCHRRLRVKLAQPPQRFWPYLVVEWEEKGVGQWEKVHADNVRKKEAASTTTSADKRQGDTAQSSVESKWARVKKLPGKEPEQIEGQETLF